MNIPGIELSEADSRVLLVSQPVAERAPVDAAMLHALLIELGYGNCALDEAAIEKAAVMCNSQTEMLGLQVAQRLDAELSVDVAADEMSASLRLTAARGGSPANPHDVMEAMAQAGVVFGIDQRAVARICEAAQSTEQTVAQGTPPQDGVDVRFDALIPKIVDRSPKLDSQRLIDYREHGIIAVVETGVPLMRRIPATAGVNGQTVKGRELTAKNGHDAPFAGKLEGTEISHDDPNLLVAAVSGQPVLAFASVKVEEIFRVKEVNMATGNIHFDGTVHVNGDVVQGMKVEASGDIVVNGLVDGGHLNAGGNITVAGGVIGHGSLRAAGAVHVRFAEGSTLVAGTLVAVSNMVIDSHLESIQQILIGTESQDRGRMLRGSATAGELLRVPLLGSQKSGLIKVSLGVNLELAAKLAEVMQRIEAEEAGEARLEKLIKQLGTVGDPNHLLDKAKVSRQHTLQQMGQVAGRKGGSRDWNSQGTFSSTGGHCQGRGRGGFVDLQSACPCASRL